LVRHEAGCGMLIRFPQCDPKGPYDFLCEHPPERALTIETTVTEGVG
jgi:hypothetical protein